MGFQKTTDECEYIFNDGTCYCRVKLVGNEWQITASCNGTDDVWSASFSGNVGNECSAGIYDNGVGQALIF